MALFRMFKVPRHQRYEYKPRYWNPEKEELQERLKRIEAMKNPDMDPDAVKRRISGSFRSGRGWDEGARRARSQAMRRSNIRLLMWIAALIFLAYLALSVYLPRIVELIEG
ncbi:MAG: hypothetical protein KDC44_05770 [Phaeodactylibacter sp.]|nr:hypothetical protein [Phaeodactylibacter sp.]